jgi:hypothetical protein
MLKYLYGVGYITTASSDPLAAQVAVYSLADKYELSGLQLEAVQSMSEVLSDYSTLLATTPETDKHARFAFARFCAANAAALKGNAEFEEIIEGNGKFSFAIMEECRRKARKSTKETVSLGLYPGGRMTGSDIVADPSGSWNHDCASPWTARSMVGSAAMVTGNSGASWRWRCGHLALLQPAPKMSRARDATQLKCTAAMKDTARADCASYSG